MLEAKRQAKLVEARRRYEQVMEQHPGLWEIEQQLVELYRQRVMREPGMTVTQWERQVKELRAQRLAYLHQHGIPEDFSQPQWDCPRCQDTGLYEGKMCTCEQQRILESRFKGAHLPKRLQEQTFSRFSLEWYSPVKRTPLGNTEREQAAEVLHICQAFVAAVIEDPQSATGLFLTGQNGLGKTFLCSAICHSLAENDVVPLYIVFSDLISDMRASFQHDSGDADLLDMARQAPVLILDDLGAEHVTDYAVSRLFDIINYRRNERLPMVISSNLTLAEVERIYSPRIVSRILEACQPVTLYGTDIRAQQRKLGIG
ncbi:MAG: ATP-binding protein [Firmicutes bacterium]|nr:ATP-binding protein [Bacillota bacterium]